MALTGRALCVLVVLLTAAAFCLTVVLLERVRGMGAKPVIARISMLLSVNLLLLLAVAIVFNDHYVFYADWTDLHNSLLGGRPASVSVHAGAEFQLPAPDRASGAPSAVQASGGRTATPQPPRALVRGHQYIVTGTRSGLVGTILISLPPGYGLPANRGRAYPVIETFHGYPGTPSQWTSSMNLRGALDSAAAQDHIGQAIIVSPSWEFPGGVDTECVNGQGQDPAVETWLTQDVPAWVRQHLRVGTSRDDWATAGLSAGGWCAAMATMLHPATYAAAIVLGGYFTPQFSANYQPYTANSALARRYDLLALAQIKPPPVQLWLQTSLVDPLSYPSSSMLLAETRAPLSVQALVLRHTGHRLSILASEVPQALEWLGKHVAGFLPTTPAVRPGQ